MDFWKLVLVYRIAVASFFAVVASSPCGANVENLISKSPFLPPDWKPAPRETKREVAKPPTLPDQLGELELRGVSEIRGIWYIVLKDRQQSRVLEVSQKDAKLPYYVEDLHLLSDGRIEVIVRQGNQSTTLTMAHSLSNRDRGDPVSYRQGRTVARSQTFSNRADRRISDLQASKIGNSSGQPIRPSSSSTRSRPPAIAGLKTSKPVARPIDPLLSVNDENPSKLIKVPDSESTDLQENSGLVRSEREEDSDEMPTKIFPDRQFKPRIATTE